MAKKSFQASSIFKQLRKSGKEVDLLLLYNESDCVQDPSFAYVSGAQGVFEGSGAYAWPSGKVVIATNSLEKESAELTGFEVFVPDKKAYLQKVMDSDEAVKRVGLNFGNVSAAFLERVRNKYPSLEFVDASPEIEAARSIKSEEEINKIRDAARISGKAFEELLDEDFSKLDESKACAQLNYEMALRGSPKQAFDSIVAFGASASQPHYTPGKIKPRKGDCLLFDFGAKKDLYCADISRTVFYGKANPILKEAYQVVLESQQAAFDALKPGVEWKEVHEAGARVIDSSKFKGKFIHGVGHSLGLEVHDPGITGKTILEKGMVLTVEPGIYLPRVGGIRIEDDVVVTGKGFKLLTRTGKDLLEL